VTSLEENAIRLFGLATSSFRATWLIDRSQLDRAVRLLHALFIESVAAR
jgi:aspartokinase